MTSKLFLYCFTALYFLIPPICAPTLGDAARYHSAVGVVYTQSGPPEKMDVYWPDKAPHETPAVIFIHGGGWIEGNRQVSEAAIDQFIDRGYALCSIDYRLAPQATYPAQLYDCKCAVRYLRANSKRYHINSGKIGAWGESAGAHLAALLGTTGGNSRFEGGDRGWAREKSDVEAVVDEYGPTDLAVITKALSGSNYAAVAAKMLLGNDPANDAQLAKDASPLFFVQENDPPFYIVHGDRDDTVPISQSYALRDTLKAYGNDVTLVVLHGAGHSGPLFYKRGVVEPIFDFLDRALKR